MGTYQPALSYRNTQMSRVEQLGTTIMLKSNIKNFTDSQAAIKKFVPGPGSYFKDNKKLKSILKY